MSKVEALRFRQSKDIEKAIQDLANKLNELITAVNNIPVHADIDEKSGKEGDMRIVVIDDKNVRLALKSKYGWHETENIKRKE